MRFKNLVFRSFKLLLALSLISLGISLIAKSSIGQSTVSGFSYNLGVLIHLKQGTALGLVNLVFFLAQIPLLKKLDLKHAFQLGMIVVSSWMTNVFLYDFPWTWFPLPESYPIQVIYLLIGIGVMALGVSLMMALEFVFMPFEGFIHLVSERTQVSFGKLRRNIDLGLVVLSLILIVLFKIPNTSVREGTLLFAIGVGSLNHRIIPFLKKTGWKDAFESKTS